MAGITDYQQVTKVTTTNDITQVTTQEVRVVVTNYDVVQVYNEGGAGAETPYKQSFVATSNFTVLATTHGIVQVKGVTLLDDQQTEMLADVSINQVSQNVTVNFGINQTGTIIIF